MEQDTLSPLPIFEAEPPALAHSATADPLLLEGETALLRGNLAKGLESFDAALKLDPENPKMYFAQGLSLFEFGSQEGQEKALSIASKKFKAAVSFNPSYFEAWQAWGSLLCTLGLNTQEHHYFQEAKEKLSRAVSLSETQGKDALSELYWDLGIVSSHLAIHSQEAVDWHQAMEAFQKAHSYDEKLPASFWHDFGSACFQFSGYIRDTRFYLQAVQCLNTAVTLEPGSCESWVLLAKTHQKLYAHTHDEDHWAQTQACFTTACQIQPEEAQLWLDWAQFLIDSARRTAHVKRLRLCIEKCQHAYTLDQEDPKIQAIWAEALAVIGSQTESFDLLCDALSRISEVIETAEEDPEVWYSYGICMQAFGKYFDDSDYYYQAIEKFQTGLSIDRTRHRHWHAIGSIYAFLGEFENNPENLELSLRFFQKALDLEFSTYTLFDYATALSKLGEMTDLQLFLEQSTHQFERLLTTQKNAVYLHPDWLFQYACTLDNLGDFYEEESYYLHAIDIFSHVLMVDPDFNQAHHRLALTLSHLGELTSSCSHFYKALHHYRLSLKNDEENDSLHLDWASTLMHLANHCHHSSESDALLHEAEQKIQTAMRLGNLHSWYQLGCLYSLQDACEKGISCLEKARIYKTLPNLDELLQDEWLDNIRSTGAFHGFLAQLNRHSNFQREP